MDKENEIKIVIPFTEEVKPVEIPLGGSLELLAQGDIGLVAWRQKRKEFKQYRSDPDIENE